MTGGFCMKKFLKKIKLMTLCFTSAISAFCLPMTVRAGTEMYYYPNANSQGAWTLPVEHDYQVWEDAYDSDGNEKEIFFDDVREITVAPGYHKYGVEVTGNIEIARWNVMWPSHLCIHGARESYVRGLTFYCNPCGNALSSGWWPTCMDCGEQIKLNFYSSENELKEVISLNDTRVIINKLNENKEENEKLVKNEDVASVYLINPETVAWVIVPNTNINYPVVQATDNNYYLSHNIYRENDKNGWVFMDFRGDVVNLSDNLILYAHNRYYNGIMFGNLQNMMRYNWYSNPDNQVITIRTLYDELHYKIFSMYRVETTTDYLQVIFPDTSTKMNMFDMIKDRSIYNFGITLNENDKILTLSTCADEYSKYVVHAVLLND